MITNEMRTLTHETEMEAVKMLPEGTLLSAITYDEWVGWMARCPICGDHSALVLMKLTVEDSEPICLKCYREWEMEEAKADQMAKNEKPTMEELDSYAIEFHTDLMDDRDDFRDVDESLGGFEMGAGYEW